MIRQIIASATVLCFAGAALAAAKVVGSKKVGIVVVKLATPGGALVPGDNDVTVSVTDAKGAPRPAKIKSLSIYMPPMPGMNEMKAEAKLAPARTPGVYTGTLPVEMKGPWTVTVRFEDARGQHKASFDVVAK
ncbi:MAG: FixH family protein [Candidatus Sericytochromatia bacterium]|nr:FixH family protein [Candidatus Tanganyikabacteria bacterium]